MAEYKKHHYVPKFHLKRFSKNNRTINIYNIKSDQEILDAGITGQCQKAYLYGKSPESEKCLGALEAHVANTLELIVKHQCSPPPFTEDWISLMMYLVFQHGRTAQMAETMNLMTDQMMKQIFKGAPEWADKPDLSDEDLDSVQISLADPALLSLGILSKSFPLIWDLDIKLLINETGVEFLLSDDPLIFYNQFLEFRKNISNTGLGAKGLQLFLPLDSKHMLVAYDCSTYRVGNHSQINVRIRNQRDILQLNMLQYANAQNCLYWTTKAPRWEALKYNAGPKRLKQRASVKSFGKTTSKNKQSEFIATIIHDIKINLKLSFINLLGSAKKERAQLIREKNQTIYLPRNPSLEQDLKDAHKAAQQEGNPPSDYIPLLIQKLHERRHIR